MAISRSRLTSGRLSGRLFGLRARPRTALLLLASALAACGGAQQGAPVQDGRCMLLTTNDGEANFDGERLSLLPTVRYQGTIDRIAGHKQRLSADRPGGVLLVTAGDILQGRYVDRPDGDRNRASRDIWQMYERAGYDLAVLGNHDFDGGPEPVRHALAGLTRMRFVVSNIDTKGATLDNTGERLYSPLEVRTCGGLKVGFIGLLTPSTVRLSKPGDTRFSNPDDPVFPATVAAVAELKRRKVDLIVTLSHLGFDKDKELAKKVPGIDAIVGGHSHFTVRDWAVEGGTVVVQAGDRLRLLGHLNMVARAGGGLDLKRSSWELVPVDDDMAPDATVTKAVDALRVDFLQEQVIGERKQPWSLRGPAKRIYGTRVAREMMRAAAAAGRPTQMGMVNMGGLRTGKTFPAGPVTNLEVQAIHPFGNRLVHVDLSGAELKSVMEHACGKSRDGDSLGVAVFGVSVRCDGSRRAIAYKQAQGKNVAIEFPGERVVDLKVGGQPVDPAGRYGLAVNDYLARGGSGFLALQQATRTCHDGKPFGPDGCKSGATLAEVVAQAVKAGSFDAPLSSP